MSSTTSDFTGTYNYGAEEARLEAEFFMDCLTNYTDEENKTRLSRLVAHWSHVLDKSDMDDFVEEWNVIVPEQYQVTVNP
jgi:hypothetical protein